LTDHLGSVNVTLNADGTIRSRLRYDPWGKQRYAQNNTPTDYRYTGQRFDSKLGIYDYRARYYDPHIGRFISADVLVPDPTNPQQYNRYTYVLNNPLRFTDPTGHYCYDPSSGADLLGTCIHDDGTTYSLLGSARAPIQLVEWEIQLLILVAYYETEGQGPRQAEYAAWIILNRHARGDYQSFESLIMSGEYHISLGERGAANFGEVGIFAYYRERGIIGENMANMAYDWYRVPQDYDQLIHNVYDKYISGGVDPTNGAAWFNHTSAGDLNPQATADRRVAMLRARADREGRSNELTVDHISGGGHEPKFMIYNNLFPPPFEQ
jgi:RHS repeat-associated protein